MSKDIIFLKSPKEEQGKEDEYHEHTSRVCGLTPHSIPVIDFNFINIEMLSTEIKSIVKYSALIFTSPRAVQAFKIAIDSLGGMDSILTNSEKFRIFVVGKATGKVVVKLGLKCEGQETGSAENLVKYILENNNQVFREKSMLFVHGNLARDTLPNTLKSAGIQLQCVCVYETIANPGFLSKFNSHLQMHGNPGFIVFFSPSGAEFHLKSITELTENLKGVKVLAIGRTTFDWLHQSGCQVHGVAEKPTPESLCHTIQQLVEENKITSVLS